MELWRNEMEEEIDRILIESFPTLHPLRVRKGGGEILMHIWIRSDISLLTQLKTPQLTECGSTIFELALQKEKANLDRKDDGGCSY